MAEAGSYSCPLCKTESPTLKLYVSHLRVVHSKDPSFGIICGVGGCREVFRTFSAFNSHIYRHHRADMGISQSQTSEHPGTSPMNLTESTSVANQVERIEYEEQDSQNENASLQFTSVPGLDHLQQLGTTKADVSGTMVAAKMLLQLREGHQASQVALTEVISGCRLLCSQALNSLKEDIATVLQTSDPERENLAVVLNKKYDPFESIDTNYLFEKYCADHLGYLVSFVSMQ